MTPTWLWILLGSFLAGSIPFGLLAGKLKGIDIRQHGSGNIGASNVLRTLGTTAAVAVLVLDAAKAALPVIWMRSAGYDEPALLVAAGLFAVAGHTWPIFLRFRGGRGVASSLGALLALAPTVALGAFSLWAVVLLLTRYISLASIAAAVSLPLFMLLFGQPPLLVATGIGLMIITVYRHVPNMKRLLGGTEPKIGQKAAHRS